MRRHKMIEGRKASYNPKYYFVWDGFIYMKYKDIRKFIDDGFVCKCVDTIKR